MSQEYIDTLRENLSILERARRRVRGSIVRPEDWLTPKGIKTDYLFSLREGKYHEIRGAGERIEICGYVERGKLYSYPDTDPLWDVVGIPKPGFYRINGRVKVRPKKEIRFRRGLSREKFSRNFVKYIEAIDYDLDDTRICFNPPLLTGSELLKILSEWVNAPTEMVLTILSSPISSPLMHGKLGGHSITLDTTPKQPIRNYEFENLCEEIVRTMVPAYHRRGSFFISSEPALSIEVERILRKREPTMLARNEVSILHPRGIPRKKVDVPKAVLFDNVITVDRSNFALDEKRKREIDYLSNLIGLSVMAHHGYFPFAHDEN